MYPRNSATPPRIALGAVVQISDGAPQTTGVSVVVRASGGAETAGGGTLAKGATTDTWYYTPTQAETNYTDFVVTGYKAGCFPVSQTIITTASATAGTTSVASIAANAITATSIASGALTIAKFAADVGTTAYASNPLAKAIWERLLSAMTTAGSAGKKLSDSVTQTGDSFARLGAPTLASIAADIQSRSTFNPATNTVANVTTVATVTNPVVTDTASRNASKADVSALATQAELDKVPKKGTAQTWTNQAGDTQTVTVTQA